MLLELREDRFQQNAWAPVLTNDFDTIDEQEEMAKAEVRLTGQLFTFPTGEAFCDMVGYSPPTHPHRTPKDERVPAYRGNTSHGDRHFKKTEPIPGYPKSKWTGPTATEIAEAKRCANAKREADREKAEHRLERVRNEIQAAKAEAKRRARVLRWLKEDSLEERRPALRPATVKLPVYCGSEPTDRPIYRKAEYASHLVGEGDEFTVLWPGHPINRRVFVCKVREEVMFHGGAMKEAVVFDMDGREMRIEAAACWNTFVFHILGEPKP